MKALQTVISALEAKNRVIPDFPRIPGQRQLVSRTTDTGIKAQGNDIFEAGGVDNTITI